MQDTILHSGALTVSINGDTAIAGKLPTLDDIARNRARSRYFDDPDPNRSEYGITESEQIYLDSQGEL